MKTILSILFLLTSVLTGIGAGDDGRFLKAVAIYSEGGYDEAGEIFRSLAAEDPADDAAYYYLGMCACRKNRFDEAEMFLSRASSLDSTNYYYRESLCMVKVAREDYEGAISGYESILRDWPRKTDTYYSLLPLYSHTGKIQKLLDAIDSIEEVAGRDRNFTLTKYDILLRQGEPDEAYSVLEEYNADVSDPQILCAMGDFQASRGNDSLALALYDEALSYDPLDGAALMGKAEIFRVAGQDEKYFDIVSRVISDTRIQSRAKGEYFMRLFRMAEGGWLRDNGDIIDSLLSTAVKLHPQDLPLTATRVQFDAVMGDWNLLLDVCEDAFTRFPQVTDFLSYRCVAYYNMGLNEEFIHENERIISSAPKDTVAVLEAYSSIGDMRYRQGKSREAFKAYDSALRIDPGYAPALNNYAYYLALKGKKLRKALQMSRKTVEANPDNATYLDTYGYLLYLLRRPQEAKPVFKHALLYGGKDSAETLYHYACVLDALGENDLAKVYFNLAESKKSK